MSEPFRSPILLWEKNPEHALFPADLAAVAWHAMERGKRTLIDYATSNYQPPCPHCLALWARIA